MKKIKLEPNELIDKQMKKHNAYIGDGFYLKSTKVNKDTIVRTYIKDREESKQND